MPKNRQRHARLVQTLTVPRGQQPVQAGLGWAGKDVTLRPKTRPAHLLAASANLALMILPAAEFAAALLDGLFEHPAWPFVIA